MPSSTAVDPNDLAKGVRILVNRAPGAIEYDIQSVDRKGSQVYAVSSDKSSGSWFDFDEVSLIVS